MPRSKDCVLNEDGSATIRFRFPRALWLVATRVAERIDMEPAAGLRLIIEELAAKLQNGDGAFLGLSVVTRALLEVKQDNFGVLAEGPEIDLSKLHVNTKLKSGYVGVYANGQGFRAMGKALGQGKGEKYLGTFQSAEEAAWRRYLYYQNNNLPYGELELGIARFRQLGVTGTDEMVKRQVLETARSSNTLHLYVDQRTSAEIEQELSSNYEPYIPEPPKLLYHTPPDEMPSRDREVESRALPQPPPEVESKALKFEAKIKARAAAAAKLEAEAKAAGRMTGSD